MTTAASFSCDVSWRRHANGTTLVAGSPLAIYVLSNAGREVAHALESGRPLPDFHRPLTARLEAAGAIHPRVDPLDEPLDSLLTVVIPAFVSTAAQHEQLTRLVNDLARHCAVIVVDDASPLPLDVPRATTVLRLDTNKGPGVARTIGMGEVQTPFAALVDSDITQCAHALPLLVATCSLDGVALVAPRVASRPGTNRIARYEERFSPLDLGSHPGRIAPGSRVSYVPSATWVVRTDVVKSLGGFDANLRVGEDVDFMWRLVRMGHTARYEPRATVLHDPRARLTSFLAQRFSYGTSVGPLSVRHPGLVRPLKASWHSVALWASLFAGLPIVSVALALWTFVGLARRLRHLDHGVREALRLVVRGHWAALMSVVRALRREWIPITFVLALSSGYLSGLALAVLVIPPITEYLRGPRRLDPFTFIALRTLDDASYGIGAWAGCIRQRTIKPLLPDLRTWRATVN